MTIINDLRKTKIYYGELKSGDYFILDDNYYIKTTILEDEKFSLEDFLAINLLTGEQYPIGNKVSVEPVEVEINIS